MTTPRLTVADDLVVSLAYTLKLDDEEIIDSSDGDDPIQFVQGLGQIVPGLERALVGLAVGDELDVAVAPADGYGEVDPDAFEELPLDAFSSEVDLEPGMELQVSDESGEVYDAYVSEVRENSVVLDFNHPLAGETLNFHVKVIDLRHATPEELAHGHVHHHDQEH
ncbi:MAG: peptidylprolyl isomerase [Planctomycetes bacterium]|nr:peptidylprolyl isomerase [Planctomycetota bacterium]